MNKDYLLELIRSKMTVFTTKDLSLLWEKTDDNFLKKKIYRYVKEGKLLPIRRGVYSIQKEYDKNELATKISSPSYISLETVLAPLSITHESENNSVCVISRNNNELDLIYLYRKYEFKNLYGIDWQKVETIFPIYDANIIMKKEIRRHYKSFAMDLG